MKTDQEAKQTEEMTKAVYEKPEIEIIEMEHEGSILQGSDFTPGGGGDHWG